MWKMVQTVNESSEMPEVDNIKVIFAEAKITQMTTNSKTS